MAHSLVGKNERRLIGAWGYVSAARLRTGDQWAKTARLLSKPIPPGPRYGSGPIQEVKNG